MGAAQSAETPAVGSHQNPSPDSGSAAVASGTIPTSRSQVGWEVHNHLHIDRETSSSAEIDALRRKVDDLDRKLDESRATEAKHREVCKRLENQLRIQSESHAEGLKKRIWKLEQDNRNANSRLQEKQTELEKERADGKLEKERFEAVIDELTEETRDLKQQLRDYETVTNTLFDEMEDRSKTWTKIKANDSFKRLTKNSEELSRKLQSPPPPYSASSPSPDAPEVRRIKTPSKSMQTISFGSDPDVVNRTISGLAVLDQELFIVRAGSPIVTVYSSKTLSFARQMPIPNLVDPGDLAACAQNRCLYVIDWKDFNRAKEIFRISPDGRVICRWPTGEDYGRLSSSAAPTLVMTVTAKNQLNEYSLDDGRTMRVIKITAGPSGRPGGLGCPPLHAVALPDGSFLVGCGVFHDDGGPEHEVCLVDGQGRRMPGGSSFGGGVDVPVGLAVLDDGAAAAEVFVADLGNGRVLKLSRSSRGFAEETVAGGEDQLQHPFRICVDKINRRLFASELLMFDCIRVKDLE